MSTCEVSGIEFQSKNGWISVKDKLPNRDARYLVAFDNTEYWLGFSSFHTETKEWNHTNITHWREMLELPE